MTQATRQWIVRLQAAGLAAAAAAGGGCQTDALFRSGRPPEGPTVIVPQTLAPRPADPDYFHAAREADLVEEVVSTRQAYITSLRELRDVYEQQGDRSHRDQAAFELAGLDRVAQFQYVLDAEVPPETLRPAQSIPEADRMYERAVKLMKQGGHGVPGLYRQDKMLEALNVLKALIRQHPTSDKIDDAAFFCGEMHKEYFPDQELIAVRWYERAMQWEPKTPHPVRFQAAVIYDYRLHDRARALELYHGVLEQEQGIDLTNTRFASRRIDELMRENRAGSPAATTPEPNSPPEGGAQASVEPR